jgi:hypothetical protein
VSGDHLGRHGVCDNSSVLGPSLGWSGASRSASRAQAVRWEGEDLARLKRELLTTVGRGDEAIQGARAEFCKHPSKCSYDELMKYVSQAEHATWHKKALEGARGTELRSLMQLLLDTKELGRLAALVGQSKDSALEDVSHYITEPAAQNLQKTHPSLAARLWRAQGMRIINECEKEQVL